MLQWVPCLAAMGSALVCALLQCAQRTTSAIRANYSNAGVAYAPPESGSIGASVEAATEMVQEHACTLVSWRLPSSSSRTSTAPAASSSARMSSSFARQLSR